jgi:hypothetical protein
MSRHSDSLIVSAEYFYRPEERFDWLTTRAHSKLLKRRNHTGNTGPEGSFIRRAFRVLIIYSTNERACVDNA